MWRSAIGTTGTVTVWCVESVNEWSTVDATAAAKDTSGATVLVRLTVYEEHNCCGDGDPVGQFKTRWVTVEAARCPTESARGCFGIHGMYKIDGQSKAADEVME